MRTSAEMSNTVSKAEMVCSSDLLIPLMSAAADATSCCALATALDVSRVLVTVRERSQFRLSLLLSHAYSLPSRLMSADVESRID